MRFKVLHILHSLRVGGLENGVINLINRMDGAGFEHEICCIDESGPMAERLQKSIRIHCIGKGHRRDYRLPFKLAKVIKGTRPDIVHTRNWSAIDGIAGARLAGVKTVIHGEHGRDAMDAAGANLLRKRVRRALSPFVSRFVTVSVELRNWLAHDVGIPERKIIQIINGVDTEKFVPGDNKSVLKTGFGLPSDSFVIGTVGRLDPVKDHQTLFRAFRYFLNTFRSAKKALLLVIGTGPSAAELKTMARELGVADGVYFLGEKNDVRELMQVMDVYVLSSIAEGISNTILEAMASGLPVIASRVGGNTELVKEQETGFFFSAGDHMALAEKLHVYADDPVLIREHGRGGRLLAEQNFSLRRMIREYEELYWAATSRE